MLLNTSSKEPGIRQLTDQDISLIPLKGECWSLSVDMSNFMNIGDADPELFMYHDSFSYSFENLILRIKQKAGILKAFTNEEVWVIRWLNKRHEFVTDDPKHPMQVLRVKTSENK